MTYILPGLVLFACVMAFWTGYHFRRAYVESTHILCTPQDVVEAVMREYEANIVTNFPDASVRVEVRDPTPSAERIAANLIQITETKGDK